MLNTYLTRLSLLLSLLLSLSLGAANLSANSQSDFSSTKIDQLVENAMQQFQVPGVGIGIIKDGEIIHLKGYGIADLDKGDLVNEDTIFKIASNSKAFTAAALAILVDEGKLSWDDKVIKYLPEFKMFDPWVTKEFNILDLLTHRSGMRKGAGDLMLWPEPTKFTRAEVVKNLRYLKPVTSFRDQYAYDNLLYIVAGEVVSSISGLAWEDFIQERIFKPLSMEQCFAGGIDTTKHKNIVAPHVVINKQLQVDTANLMNNKTSLMAAAGGIKCSTSDLLKWVKVLLNDGVINHQLSLFSTTQRDLLWKSVTPLPLSAHTQQLDDTHYRGYALGWRVSDYHGEWRVSHTGTLSGSMSQIIMLPDLNLGVIVLTNQQSSAARNSLARGILQEFTSQQKIDWVDFHLDGISEARKARELVNKNSAEEIEPFPKEITIVTSKQSTGHLGHYIDPWFGKISLTRDNENIIFQSEKSPRLVGKVFFKKDNQWWVKWNDRSFFADAWLIFKTNAKTGKIHLSMKPISPFADFSFDFEDLAFIKSKP